MMDVKMGNSITLQSIRPESSVLKKNHGFESGNDPFQSVKRESIQSCVTQVYFNGKLIPADRFHENDGSMAAFMQILVFCNEYVNGDRKDERPDPEKTLLDFAATKGFYKKLFDKIIPKIAEVRVDGNPGSVSAIIGLNGRYRLVTKDDPNRLMGRCDKILFKGKAVSLTANIAAKVHNVYQGMIHNNLQVVMLALKDMDQLPPRLDQVFQTNGLTLVGMIGLGESIPDNPENQA